MNATGWNAGAATSSTGVEITIWKYYLFKLFFLCKNKYSWRNLFLKSLFICFNAFVWCEIAQCFILYHRKEYLKRSGTSSWTRAGCSSGESHSYHLSPPYSILPQHAQAICHTSTLWSHIQFSQMTVCTILAILFVKVTPHTMLFQLCRQKKIVSIFPGIDNCLKANAKGWLSTLCCWEAAIHTLD